MTEGRVLHKQIEGGQSRSPHFCERVTEQKWPTRVKAFTVEERSWKVARRAQVQGEVWLSCPVFFFLGQFYFFTFFLFFHLFLLVGG